MPEHVADNLLRDRRPQHFNRTGVTEHMRSPRAVRRLRPTTVPDHAIQVRHRDIGRAGPDEDLPRFGPGPPMAKVIEQRLANRRQERHGGMRIGLGVADMQDSSRQFTSSRRRRQISPSRRPYVASS
jgi:hypothetical protein